MLRRHKIPLPVLIISPPQFLIQASLQHRFGSIPIGYFSQWKYHLITSFVNNSFHARCHARSSRNRPKQRRSASSRQQLLRQRVVLFLFSLQKMTSFFENQRNIYNRHLNEYFNYYNKFVICGLFK